MFMRLRKPLTNKQILKIVSLLNKSRKVLTVIGLIGIVWSSGPMQYLNAMNTQEIDFKNYIENDNFRENLSNTEDINYLDIPISHEVIDERTINTKTFQRIDGSYVTSIYSDAIHYFTEDNWENVDNSLNLDDTNNSFENKNNSFKVKFPKTLDDNKQIKLSKDGYNIDWNILSINESSIENDNTNSNPSNIKELININQSLLYSNIQPGVDVEYIITGSKVKENIILNNYIPNFNLSFEYKLKDLTLEEDDNGNVFFINSQGEKVFSFYELYMIDSNRNVSYDISFNIEELGNKEYLVTIVPNDNWLNNAQYPVTIDPTINSMDQWISIYDTTIDSTYVNNNYYNVNEMAIGSGYEGLVSFDIPSYLQDKVITYATLELTKALPYSSVIGDELVLHENTSNFDDTTVTWATWDGLSKYTNEIVDYQIISSSDKYLFNITESVINWVREGTMNVPGFTIKAKEGGSGLTVVESSEGTHGSMIPDINIGYVDPAGIKDYWTYSSHDIGLAGTGYISDYTGLLNIVRNDFEFSTEKQTLGLSMIYSAANFDENIGYGYGWRTNYDLTVQYDTDADRYSSTDSSGSTEFYQRKSTCDPKFKFDVSYNYTCYDAEDGSSNVLVIEKDSSYNLQNYYIVTPEDMIYKFDIYNVTSKVGYLTEIKDGTTVNELTISVNRQTTGLYKIDNVVDQSGNIFDFDYDTNGNIEEITLQLMQSNLSLGQIIEKVSYTVNDLKGTLTNVQYSKDYDLDGTFSDEPSVIYYYDTNELIEYAETSNAEKVLYNIDSASKRTYDMDISYNGSNIVSYDYTYDYKKTKIDDNFGNFIVYKFDDFGHTINMFDSYGYIQSYQYVNLFTEWDNGSVFMKEDGTPEYRYNHHLIGTSAPIKDNANRVTNGSFEFGLSNDGWSLISVDSFGSYSRVTAESILDNYSAKISSTSEEETYLQQMITLDAGVYTLSGFVFNETLNNEVFLSVNGHSYGGVVSKVVNNQEWVENKVRFVVEENNTNVYIRLNNNSTGAAYFDGVQVYEGFGENIPNLLENPSFEDIESNWIPGWEDTTTGEVELVSSGFPTESYLDFLGSNAIKIYGNPVQGRSYEIDSTNGQRINISSDVFTVGGWALTEGTPVSKSDADAYNRFFRIKVGMYDVNDSQVGDYLYVDFDSTIDGWQFNNSSFEVETGTSYLRLWVEYQGEGYVLFDNLSVYNGTLYTRYFYSEDTSGAPEVIIVEPSGDETVYTYDSSDTYSNVPMMISADGETTTISKDSKNNIQTITNDNVTTEFSSNDDGVTTGLSLESGATEYMSFSTTTLSTGFGQYTQSFTDEFGAKTKFYDDMVTGLLEAIENSEGIHTKYVYDDYGNIERVEITDDYTSSTSNVFGYTVYGYDTEGRINKIWLDYDENPNMYYEIVYDSSGRMDKVKIGTTILMDYDYKSKPYGYETNLVEKQTYGNLDEMSFSYDTRDRLESISFKESNETNEKLLYKYLYDEQDRISVKEEYDPNDSETVVNRVYYGYDISGRITRIYDEKGNDYVYGYDIDGNLSTLDITVDNDIEHKTTYSYGDSDRTELVSVVNINGVNVRQDYIYSTDDALERLNDIQTTYGTDLIIEKNFLYDGYTDRIDTITYDLTTASGADVKYEYTYYDNGNIRYVRYYSDNMSTPKTFHGYSYDELDQLEYVKSRDYSVGDTTFTDTNNTKFYYYDDRGNIIETKTFLFTQMDTFTPSNVTTNLQNYGLEPAEVFHSNGTHYTVPVQLNLNDNFDPLVDMDYTFLHEPSQTDITGYVSNQLCTSNLNTSIENNYYVQCEVYDDWGDFYFTFQIKIIVGNPVSGPRTPIESMSYTYDQDWSDLLTSYDIIKDGTTYRTEIEYEDADGNATYDPQGTPKVIREYEDTTLVRLIELSWSGRDLTTYKVYGDELKTNHISTLTFTYNDEGIRTSKSYEDIADPTKDYTVEYTLIDDRVIYETDGDYGIFYTYDENGIIISFNYDSDVTDQIDGNEYFYIRNLQGDVTAITDSSGAIVVEYKYDSFGNIVDTSVGSGYEEILEHNSYTYRGYRQDKETNWYYLQSRYYNAETGRFINSDVYIGTEGLPQSTNIFAYTFNNPINYIDPNGDWGFTIRINWKTSTVANIIDIAIAAAGLIAAVGSFTVLVKLIKAGRKMIYTKIKKALISAGLAIATSLLNTAFSVINLFSDLSSLGGLVAHGLDYMDGSYDGRIKYRIKIGR